MFVLFDLLYLSHHHLIPRWRIGIHPIIFNRLITRGRITDSQLAREVVYLSKPIFAAESHTSIYRTSLFHLWDIVMTAAMLDKTRAAGSADSRAQ